MDSRTVIIGIGIALMAWAIGLNILTWQWWLFIISANVVLSAIRAERQE